MPRKSIKVAVTSVLWCHLSTLQLLIIVVRVPLTDSQMLVKLPLLNQPLPTMKEEQL